MKIMEIISDLLILEYSNKLKEDLIKKFKNESPHFHMEYGDEIFDFYINRFNVIKNSPNILEKDITKYSWSDLQDVVNNHSGKRIKAGKLNSEEVTNSELVFNENGLRIYSANSTKSCVKYGNGYNFCISARGDDNMFDSYSVDSHNIGGRGTPYFVFDDEKSNEKRNDDFVDPSHLLVIYKYLNGSYTVTTASNNGNAKYKNFSPISRRYPKLSGLEHLFKLLPPPKFESKKAEIKENFHRELNKLRLVLQNYDTKQHMYYFFGYDQFLSHINEIISGKQIIYQIRGYVTIGEKINPAYFKERIIDRNKIGNKLEFEKKIEDDVKHNGFEYLDPGYKFYVKLLFINPEVMPLYKTYLHQVKNAYDKYKYEIMKLNLEN